MRAVDLFAGPGGWDVAARTLDVDPLGIEWNDAACAVRAAAGLPTLQADVADLDPSDYPCELLIASPPCTAFSMAGKGEGRRDVDLILSVLDDLANGRDTRAQARDALGEPPPGALFGYQIGDPSSLLVVEPLRWALATRPRLIALEQVPPVLALWQKMADYLVDYGYGCWTGIVSAEQHGVAQTRKRAILLASLNGFVPPTPTHTLYVKGAPREAFGLKPWVSMADALGWGMTDRPYPAIASSRTTGGPDKEKVGGSAARAVLYEEQAAGRWKPPWAFERPATTIQADSRVWPPGHKQNADDVAAGRLHYEGRAGENAIRVTEQEAARLQSFPDDYPWAAAGTRSAQFQCIGNAVPPLMGAAVLKGLLGR